MTIHQTACFVVLDDMLEVCRKAVHECVDCIRWNEPDILLYTSLMEKDTLNHFMYYLIFRDAAARDLHANSDAVKRFTNALYPNLVAPVEFTEYVVFANTKLSWAFAS